MRFDRFEKMPILRWDLGRSSGLPWRPNNPPIMGALIEDITFAFFTTKMRFDRFEKMPILRWDLGRSSRLPWRPNDH